MDPPDRLGRDALPHEIIDVLVEAWRAQDGPPGMVAESFANEGARTDGGFYHDNLALVNDPVYYSAFVQHAAHRGFAVLADADPATLSYGGASEAYRARLASKPAVARDQMLDFVHARALRLRIRAPQRALVGVVTQHSPDTNF